MKVKSRNLMMNKWQLLTVISAISIILSIGGYVYYQYEKNSIKREKHNELKAIANLKAREISEWYKDEIYDAKAIAKKTKEFENLILNSKKLSNSEKLSLTEKLAELADEHGYENILLTDTTGKLLISLKSNASVLDPATKRLIKSSIKKREIVSMDLYFCPMHNQVHLDEVVPVINELNNILGTLILRINPDNYLFPLIANWPIPSKTAETLLIRKEGNNVVFINKLRHITNKPLSYRIPLTEKNVPAVQAILGARGIYEGVDYRGVKVLSELLQVKDTPWFMISKVDRDEIYSELNFRAISIGAFTFVLILMISFGLGWIYNLRQRNIYKELFLKEKNLAEKEEEYKTTLYSIGDGVITTDINGCVKQMNPIAEQLTGWSEKEARGEKLETVFNIINEESRLPVENPVQVVLKNGVIVGLANHTLLISKNGNEVPITDSGAPIRTEDGVIIGVVLVFRDQAAERESEKKLRDSEERNNALLNANPDMMFILDKNGVFLDYKKSQNIELLLPPEVFLNKQLFDVLSPELAQKTLDQLNLLFNTGKTQVYEYQLEIEGELKHFESRLVPYGEDKALSIARDITDKKATEEALSKSEKRYQTLANNSPVGIFHTDAEGLTTYVNPQWCVISGMSFEDALGNGWVEAVHPEDRIKLIEVWGETTKSNGFSNAEYRFLHSDGSVTWVLGKAVPELDSENKIIGYVGTITDITERKIIEETLRESEESLNAAQEYAKLGSWEMEVGTAKGKWSKQMFRMFDLDPADGVPAFEEYLQLIHPEDRPLMIETLDKISKGINPESVVYRTNPERGEVRYFLPTGKCVRDEHGNTIKVMGSILDITERMLYEEALRENERIFNQFMKYSPVYVFFKDENMRSIRLSKNYEKMLGKPIEELLGKNTYELFPSELAKGIVEDDMKILKEGLPVEVEEEFNGRYYSTIKFPIHRTGKSHYLAGFTLDITDRKLAEKSIRKLSRGIEQSPAAVIITDKSGRIEYVNPKFTEVTGYSLDFIRGRVTRILRQGTTEPEKHREIWDTINSGKEWRGEFQNKKENGELYWESISISSIINEQGEISNFILITEDISERKKMIEELIIAKEEAINADKLKSEFLAQMSHEIRTPLNTVLNYTSLLKEEYDYKTDEDIANIFRGISNASKRVIRTIDLILNVSQMTTNVYDYRPKKIDIYTDVIQKVQTELSQTAASKGVMLRIEKQTESTEITVDEYSVSQIFINIVENAIKYTKKGFVELRILRNKKNQMQVEVEDSGVGMSEEYLEKIFTPFSQEETGYTRRYEGTGLGLSLVKKYCDLNNATIEVKSKKNEGTTFTVIFQ